MEMDVDEVSTTTGAIGIPPMNSDETMALMQAQIDMQKEKIKELVTLTKELQAQVQELIKWKESMSISKSSQGSSKIDDGLILDWTNGNGGSTSVADLVRQTAEQIVAKQEGSRTAPSTSGFVYNKDSGWYFDASSGFYYEPRTQLSYSVHDKKYYKYDNERKEYDLCPNAAAEHELSKFSLTLPNREKARKGDPMSALKLTDTTADELPVPHKQKSKKKRKLSKRAPKKVKEEVGDNEGEIEEGELSTSSQDSSDMSSEASSSTSTIDMSDDEEPAPCIRAVIVKSSVEDLKKGTLFIITCMGGTIGREGPDHTVLIPDSNMSKIHGAITYESIVAPKEGDEETDAAWTGKTSSYYISDCGSKNGTFLNGIKISGSKHEIVHGSTLRMGDTTLLLHIHPGQLTCGHCEPGLLIEKEPMYTVESSTNRGGKEALRRKEMNKIRKKFGLQGDVTAALSRLPVSYKDRAEERRITKGSDNPFEKTEIASIDEPIKEDNRGYGLMKKMGWADGGSLGQSGQEGIKEPIKFELKSGRSGLGSSSGLLIGPSMPCPINDPSGTATTVKKKPNPSREGLKIVKQRYDQIRDPEENDP